MRNVGRRVALTAVLGLLVGTFFGANFYFVEEAQAMVRDRLVHRTPFTALGGGKARISASNLGKTPVMVVMRLINLDTGRVHEDDPTLLGPAGGGGTAAPDSFFDIFLDLGECRYRAQIDVASQGGRHNVAGSLQHWDANGNNQLYFDTFESFRTLAP